MLKVIIVDDEFIVRVGIKSVISWEENGFSIVGDASNGKKALEIIGDQHPDIVITDIKMPVMNGIELIKAIKTDYPGIVVIALSCHDEFNYVKEALKNGAEEYFLKNDLEPAELLKTLNTLKEKLRQDKKVKLENIRNDEKIKEYDNLKKNHFITQIIGNTEIADEELDKKVFEYKFPFNDFEYTLAVIKVDNYYDVFKKYKKKDNKILSSSIKNIIDELFANNKDSLFFSVNNYEYILVHYNTSRSSIIKEYSERIKNGINKFLDISVSIGISGQGRGIYNFKKLYNQANEAVNYRFFRGKGNIIFFNSLSKKKCLSSISSQFNSIKHDLKGPVKFFDLDDVYKIVGEIKNKILEEIKTFYIDENEIRNLYLNFINQFCLIFSQEYLVDVSDIDIYNKISNEDDIFGVENVVKNFVAESFENIKKFDKNSNVKQKDKIKKAIEYIETNYDSEIDLNTLAYSVGFSPSYFSRIFKIHVGENFSNYLIKLRMEKAKQLLKNGYKAFEVAEKVGYFDYTHFSKMFKKIVGKNPSKYK